jgi:hypothetical protein
LNPNNERYELWRGVTSDGGQTFAWTPVTTNSTQDNFRPYVPRRNGGEPCVIWFRGSYPSYTTYSTAIVGLFTTAVPAPPPPPPPGPLTGAVTYVDATSGVGGNTTLANGTVFNPPLNVTNGADQNWEQRTPFASSGNIFESGGEASEDAPELRMTLTNLIAGANYFLHAFLWDATNTSDHWSLRAGFTSAPGANPLYSAPDGTGSLGATAAVVANSLTYATAPTLYIEGNRVLHAAPLGIVPADTNGAIRVYVDDKPSGTGANNRTWFDGLGYALVTAMNPTNLTAVMSSNQLVLAWPADHAGWILQAQTNSLASGLQAQSNLWFDVPGSSTLVFTNLPISPATPTVFYRLRSP